MIGLSLRLNFQSYKDDIEIYAIARYYKDTMSFPSTEHVREIDNVLVQINIDIPIVVDTKSMKISLNFHNEKDATLFKLVYSGKLKITRD